MPHEGPRSDTPAEEVTEEGGSPLDRFLPQTLRTGRRRVLQRDEQGRPTDAVTEESIQLPRQLGEVGAHVELVLAAAEQAAEQIRQEALQAANEIRAEAGLDAARMRRELEEAARASERQRAEVGQYVVETRTAADAQAEQVLREADAEAAKIKTDATRQGGRMLAEAERRGHELEETARTRVEQLADEAHQIEARLDDWLTTLRAVTQELERRLAVDTPAEPDAGSESLDEALAPPASRESDAEEGSADGPSPKARSEPRSKSH
jgi:hypothetical protein